MSTLSEADATQAFADLIDPLLAASPLDAAPLVQACFDFYRNVRIEGAEDSMMLEWGTGRPHRLVGFTDIRHPFEPEWDVENLRWLGVTRQVMSDREDESLALCLFLYFGPADGTEPLKSLEFSGLEDLDRMVSKFLANPYVAGLLQSTPSRVTAFASEMG